MSAGNDDVPLPDGQREDDQGRMKNFPKVCSTSNGKVSYPFLVAQDPRDYELFKQLAVEEPWAAANKGAAWEKVKTNLESITSCDGTAVFPWVSLSTIQNRFKAVVKGMASYSGSAPFRSGCDDEAHDDFVDLVEDVVNKCNDWKLSTRSDKERVNEKREADKKDAEKLRRVSLGELTREEMQALSSDSKTPKKARITLADISNKNRSSEEFIASFTELKRKQMALENRRLEIEQQRLNDTKEERKEMQQMMMSMIGMLSGQAGTVAAPISTAPFHLGPHYPAQTPLLRRAHTPTSLPFSSVQRNGDDDEVADA
jgi:hypothetical protein